MSAKKAKAKKMAAPGRGFAQSAAVSSGCSGLLSMLVGMIGLAVERGLNSGNEDAYLMAQAMAAAMPIVDELLEYCQ